MGQKKRLGRGLQTLLSDPSPSKLDTQLSQAQDRARPEDGSRTRSFVMQRIPLDAIEPNPSQPRRKQSQERLQTLVRSIRANGLVQPIVVRPIPGTPQGPSRGPSVRYQLIAGERRWRAALSAQLLDIPAIIRDASDEQMLQLALIENLHREELNAIDRALAYRQLQNRFGLTPDEIGERMAEDRSTVTNYLRLLDLEEELRGMVAAGLIGMGHARALLGIEDRQAQAKLAHAIVAKGLSVREVEEWARRHRGASTESKRPARSEKRAHIRDLERRFEEALGTRVSIAETSRKNKGRIIIEYSSLDDFDRILGKILGPS